MTQDNQNREIDALVSSVRDLVRQKPRSGDAALAAPLQRDVLVLTPQMRCDRPAPVAADIAPEPQAPATPAPKSDALVLGAGAQVGAAMPLNLAAAKLEAAVTAQADEWEIDGGEAFAKEAWAASAFTRHPDESHNVTPPAVDEAALRAMITQILREELTGQTGEKITGNLRKLVRHEIARVMAPQIADQGK